MKRIDESRPLSLSDQFITDRGARVLWGAYSSAEELASLNPAFRLSKAYQELQKSDRTDYAKAIDIRIPNGYHARVRKVWEVFESDQLFRYLIDRIVDFAVNGFEWEVPLDTNKEGLFQRFLKRVSGTESPSHQKMMQEKQVWDAWSARINEDVPNVIPGLDEVLKWTVKHLPLNGMVPLEWEWGEMKIGKQKYDLPIRMISHNALSVLLARKNDGFIDEQAFLRLSPITQLLNENISTLAQVTEFMTPPSTNGTAKSSKKTDSDPQWRKLNLMSPHKLRQNPEAFVLKYNWSPGDNTVLFRGKEANVGQGLYPSVQFAGLFPIYMVRQALIAADLAILDGMINMILDWEIGDGTTKDAQNRLVNHPRAEQKNADGSVKSESTIALIKKMITSDTRGNVMQIFRPYWVKPHILQPDPEALINHTKYIQSTIEMLSAFGILMMANERGSRAVAINTANFEQMLENIRRNHVRRFFEALAAQIVRRNEGKLTVVPNMVFRTLNTQDAAFRQAILQIFRLGRVSAETALQVHGLDKRTELMRAAGELSRGESEVFNRNIPPAFVQGVAKPTGRPPGETPPQEPEEEPEPVPNPE